MENEPFEITDEDRRALAAWQIGLVLSAALPASGTVNRTVIVQTEVGSFVLRTSSREQSRIEWEHECIAWVGDYDLPVCRPIPLPDSGTILKRDTTFCALFPLASGQQIERAGLRAEHAQAAGECLARIHAAFRTFPAKRARVKNLTGGTLEALSNIPYMEATISALPTCTNVEWSALEQLAGRRRWLEQSKHLTEGVQERLAALPQMVLHGDYQDTNLFFQEEQVSAVIDWDQSGLAARGWEVVRALHLMFVLDPDLCKAFLGGYRLVLPLSENELQEAAACYGVLADNNLWIYMASYLEGNARAKRFIRPDPFVPFQRQWEAAGLNE